MPPLLTPPREYYSYYFIIKARFASLRRNEISFQNSTDSPTEVFIQFANIQLAAMQFTEASAEIN